MLWQWIKTYLPRGLYGRAALILILPVLLLQLLVSVVFIQRHFDGVTQSMTSAVNIELRFLRDLVNDNSEIDLARAGMIEIAGPLEIGFTLPASGAPVADSVNWDDFTGGKVISVIRDGVDGVLAISLARRSVVKIWLSTNHGPLLLEVNRSRVSASNPHQLLVIMVIIGALMTTIAYFFLRNQLRPIKRLAAAAADYGKGRITPFTPTGAVEVRAAGMAFLDMRNRIERQVQNRTMMLSGVSHDLRTPLTRLRLALSMLDDADTEPMIRDVDEMRKLLDGFLAFARDDASDTPEKVDPRDILNSVLEDAARIAQPISAGDISGPQIKAALRPMAIRRALDNLTGNALRYGARAQISLHITDRTIGFTVEDDGPGIPAKDHEAAMSPFVRLDPARNQDKGSGVGLGLAIVADIARSHGGVLRLGESKALGGLKAELILAR